MPSSSSGDSSTPPPDSSSDNNSPPPPDSSNSNSNSSPSDDSSNSSSSPPPPDSSSSSPPPPDDSNSPPPPSQDSNDSKSPPPPQDSNSGSNQSPPPPPSNNNNNNDNNDNDNDNDKSPPPPPPKSSSSNGDSQSYQPPPPPPPPPPPHSGALSPPKHKSSPSSKHKESSSNEKETIVGVLAGAGLLLLIMIALVYCCCCKKKKKRRATGYYMDNSQASHGDYYNSGQPLNWSNPMQSSNNMYRMPPSGQVSSEQGWPIAPPPPPPMMSSSELSSAAYSGPVNPPPHPAMALGFNQSSFTYEDLAAATGGFSKANLLGQGGFGYVHKGVLPNGKEVAVKSLKANSGQGEREFQAEVEIISRVHHRHLVSLVGYCIAGAQRMLVYEFVANNTLEYHLYGQGRPVMDFPTRLKIAIGAAKGLAYLHEDCHPRIIHRDIKTANILIDFNFEAKVADFGLAKLSSDTNTHVSTRIMGTFGYLAPEYAASGKLTEKSDVFSYGVMLLELITGKRPVDVNEDDSLVDWARPILMRAADGGSYEEIVEPRLENNYDHDEMLRMVACAGVSIRHSARRRPKMSQIVRALEGDVSLEDLNGLKPGQSPATSGGSDYDSFQMDLRKHPRSGMSSSQEFTSSEHFPHSGAQSQELRPIVPRPIP